MISFHKYIRMVHEKVAIDKYDFKSKFNTLNNLTGGKLHQGELIRKFSGIVNHSRQKNSCLFFIVVKFTEEGE